MIQFDLNWVSYNTITKNGTYKFEETTYLITKGIATQMLTTCAHLVQATIPAFKQAVDYVGDDAAQHVQVEIGFHQAEVKEDFFDTPYHLTVRVPTLGAVHVYIKVNNPPLGKECYGLQLIRLTYGPGGVNAIAINGAPLVDSAMPKGKQKKWDMSKY